MNQDSPASTLGFEEISFSSAPPSERVDNESGSWKESIISTNSGDGEEEEKEENFTNISKASNGEVLSVEEEIINEEEETSDQSSSTPWYLKHVHMIGATGVLSFIVGALFSYGLSSIFESKTYSMMNDRIYHLEHTLKQKQYDLHVASEKLNNEIEISRAASKHNIELSKQKEYFEAQYLVQSRNLNLANEEIQDCQKTIDNCRKRIQLLENSLQDTKKHVENLESDITKKEKEISQLTENISKYEIQIKDQQTTIQKQKERISTLKETHRIFEYVLHKASPQLASRIINQIHRVQNTNEQVDILKDSNDTSVQTDV